MRGSTWLLDAPVQEVSQNWLTIVITVVTAVAGLFTALALLLGAIPKLRRTEEKIDTVHTLVNQQHTDLQRYIVALTQTLRNAGIEIPIDQSLPVPGYTDPRIPSVYNTPSPVVAPPQAPVPTAPAPTPIPPTPTPPAKEPNGAAIAAGFTDAPALYVEVVPAHTDPEPDRKEPAP